MLRVLMESCPQSVYKAKSDLMFSDLIPCSSKSKSLDEIRMFFETYTAIYL